MHKINMNYLQNSSTSHTRPLPDTSMNTNKNLDHENYRRDYQ